MQLNNSQLDKLKDILKNNPIEHKRGNDFLVSSEFIKLLAKYSGLKSKKKRLVNKRGKMIFLSMLREGLKYYGKGK